MDLYFSPRAPFKAIAYIVLSFSLTGCASTSSEPEFVDDGIEVVNPASEGVDISWLKKADHQIIDTGPRGLKTKTQQRKGYVNINSMLVARNGKLLFERYYNGSSRSQGHPMASLGKSVLSAVTGVAIDKHYFASVNDSIYDHLPYVSYQNWSVDKQHIQLKHLLTMSTGWQCGSIMDYASHCGAQMHKQPDPYKWVLDLLMEAAPGEVFNYNDAVPAMLSALLTLAIKGPIAEFYQQSLMEPMGIQNNVLSTAKMTSREMLKFGQLFLNKGMWQGQQLVSESWIEQSTSRQVTFQNQSHAKGYGYLWWIHEFKIGHRTHSAFYAGGNGGQYIIVVPELNLIAVFTGSNYNNLDKMRQPFEIMENCILPGIFIQP